MESSTKLHLRSPNKMGGSKYKKIMSHVSNFLHGTPKSTTSRRMGKNKAKLSKPVETEKPIHSEEQCHSIPENDKNEVVDCDPEYSTIKEVTAVVHEPAQSTSSPKVTPPKSTNVEDLYAKVDKKSKRRTGSSLPSVPLESVPGTSGLSNSGYDHQLDINHDASKNTAVKQTREAEPQHSESMLSTETNVDELHTWHHLLQHQQQHAKRASQVKLYHQRKYEDSYRVENRVPKQSTPIKKGILSNERLYQHSHFNFPTTEKSVRCTHYRSLEDFSTLAAQKEDAVNKIWQECQEEMMKFQQNVEQVVEENKVLHQEVHNLLQKEAKWREEKENMMIHKQDNHLITQKNNILMQELSAVHEQKEKEVKHLSYQVQRLQAEKSNLLEKLHSTLHEKETLEYKYSRMCEKSTETVSYAVHAQTLQENQRLLNDMRKKHQEDTDRILESCRDVENEKNNLSIQVQILKDEIKNLNRNNITLKSSSENALKARDLTLSQLEQSKKENSEMQDLLISLLKLAEEATTERDIALTKAEFQEKQQTKIQGTVVEHSIGIGRLQEHIVNIRRRVSEDMRNIEMR